MAPYALSRLTRRPPACREAWIGHHRAHAASAWRVSGLESAGVLVVDGAGEREATSLYEGRDGELELIATEPRENSLGLLYRTVSDALGMGWWGEGKTMGLAPYGTVRDEYASILHVSERGYRVDIGRARRLVRGLAEPETPTQKAKDIAATLQHLLERAVVALVHRLRESVGTRDLCLTGGVALNCSANRAVLDEGDVGRLFIQPAAHDAGGALGAALEAAYDAEGTRFPRMTTAFLGPGLDPSETREACRDTGLATEVCSDPAGSVAELLADGRVGAVVNGRSEFGPRALGNRSIVADPRERSMHERVNRIKGREGWRPLAPALPLARAPAFLEEAEASPFMLLNFTIREERRDEVPAVVHVDGTAPDSVPR